MNISFLNLDSLVKTTHTINELSPLHTNNETLLLIISNRKWNQNLKNQNLNDKHFLCVITSKVRGEMCCDSGKIEYSSPQS